MGLFYTGKGDKGASKVGKVKMDKSCLEAEVLGTLDELNSLLGLIKSQKDLPGDLKKHLENVQEKLFIIQAHIAALVFKGKQTARITTDHIKELEAIIEALEKEIKPAKKFILSGEHELAAWLDYARAVSRKVEREVVRFKKTTLRRGPLDKTRGKLGRGKVSPETIAFLNRLSSFLFALARSEMKKSGKKEKHPSYK